MKRLHTNQRSGKWLTLAAVMLSISAGCQGAGPSVVPLTVDQIVDRMVAMNQARAVALRSYTSTCVYHVENENHNKSADVVVRILYRGADAKETTVVSQSGSELLRNRVLSRLMEGEEEASREENRRRTDLSPQNYNFRLLGYDYSGPHGYYVLELSPKVKSKFIFQGRVWVNADDFAVVRMEGMPAKNPSWWTTHIDVYRSYCKVGDFWLPSRHESIAQVRMFGRSVLTIVYTDYKLLEARSVRTPALLTALPLGVGMARN